MNDDLLALIVFSVIVAVGFFLLDGVRQGYLLP